MPLIIVMSRFTLKSFQLNIPLNLLHIQTPFQSDKLMIMKWNISCNSSTQNRMMIFWMLTSIWLMIDWWFPLDLKCYTVYTVLFHRYGGQNIVVTNCMSHFYMFVPTKATIKLANGNKGNAQGIWIILCCFHNCSIIYPVGPVYYCTGHPSNTI